MKRTPSQHRVNFRGATLGVIAALAVLAAVLANPSSAQDAEPAAEAAEFAGFDVVDFLSQYGVVLPADAANDLDALTEQGQQQRLISLGVDRSILQSDFADRPMPLVAELLRVLDPDAPRPEVASDVAYARSMVDAAAGEVIDDLQVDYSSRLGFARWDDAADGSRTLVIPVVGASEQEVAKIAANDLPAGSRIRVERTDISYQDLKRLKDAVRASIEATTGNRLGDWSIGINRETRTVFVRIDASLERNKKILAGIGAAALSATTTVDEGTNADGQVVQQTGDLLTGGDDTGTTANRGRTSDSQTGDLLARLARIVRDAADTFVAAEIPSSSRTGAEMLTFANVKMEPPDTDYRESSHIRGGEWVTPDSGGSCTTNFLWKKGSQYRMGTGGHCSTTTGNSKGHRAYRTFYHRTLAGSRNGEIGKVTHNGWTNGSYSDYALMTLPAAVTKTNRIMTTSGNWRTVIGVSALSNLGIKDLSVCHVGWGLKKTYRLDKSCGTIKESDIDQEHILSTGETLKLYGLYCTTAKRAGGDSGGPHYLEIGDSAYAVGIHHGAAKGYACFTTVQAAKARSGYSVALN